MLTMVLQSVNIPIEGIALVAGIDRLFDMGRTTINITGDAACALIVSKMEDRKEARTRCRPGLTADLSVFNRLSQPEHILLRLAPCSFCKANNFTDGGAGGMRTGEKEGRGALRQKNSHKNGKKGLQNGKIFCRITLYRHRPWPVHSGPRRSFPGAPRNGRPHKKRGRVEEDRWSF